MMEPSLAAAPRRIPARRFYFALSLVMTAAAFAGFAPSYFLSAYTDAPALPLAIHIHGALSTAWMLLIVLQTGLVMNRRVDLHRLTGAASALLIPAIAISGTIAALRFQTRVHTEANAGTLADPYVFLAFPIFAVGLFTIFGGAGVVVRRQAEAHKRLMMLASMSLVLPALARIVRHSTSAVPGPFGGLGLMGLLVVALAVHDVRTRGRIHPVTMWGGGLLLVSAPLRVLVGLTPAWQKFAHAVMT